MTDDHAARLCVVQAQLADDFRGAVLVESWSNDTWVTDDLVLRVCWQGDRDRLRRERAILDSLPPSIPHATVVDFGSDGELTWTVLRRIVGLRLDLAWPELSANEQREAVVIIASLLESLHRWIPPDTVRQSMLTSLSASPLTTQQAVGSCVVPVPHDRITPLLERLDALSGVSPELARAAAQRIEGLASSVSSDEFISGVVVHGDAHFANVLWHGGAVVALLDFEWARIGPPDLELEAACREDPYIEINGRARSLSAAEVPLLESMCSGYPQLFERTNLTERLWLYELSHHVRRLCATDVTAASHEQRGRLERLVAMPRVRFA